MVEGRVHFDDRKIASSSVSITLDAASVDTGVAVRDAALRGTDWFDAEANPKISFVSKSVRRVDENRYVITGDLTVRGVSRPVDFSTVLSGRATNPFLNVPAVGYAPPRAIRGVFNVQLLIITVIDR
jgi:polyisoprenoid-binding protein YceI